MRFLAALQDEVRPLYEMATQATSDPTLAKFRKEYMRNLLIDQNMGVKWKAEYLQTRTTKRNKL